MKLKILIADKFPDKYIEQMKKLNLEVTYEPTYGEKDLVEAAKEVDILVVRSTKVNEDAIKNSKNLNLIIRAGSGVNNINIQAANKKGIYVANCPGMNAVAVAELAVGLMISLDRFIPDSVIDFRNGVWNKAKYSKGKGLKGKTLGIIGVGAIGKEVAKRALAFEMNVYGKDITRIEGVQIKDFSEMDKLLPLCDVVTVHLPATEDTIGLFNKKMFGYMKDGALLINTSRHNVIVEEDLLEAIKEKNIRFAGDVFKGEPEAKTGEVKSHFQNNPNIYITHHIGASTEQAQDAVAQETVNIINHYAHSGIIDHWVNRAKITDAHYQLVVKHYDKPGVLAGVLDLLREGDINIEEIENVIFDGALAASCTMKLINAVSPDMLKKMKENPNIISVSHVEI
ncbi:MAG: phosphoglycerate dehydrogenase [Ignavibacteria bacterium]|nr:phosphoglycerate dehydrogenase [Ignavibacteria bacterium]MBT8382583.1 phosphoglycerate dehydrogenase [Ignavibacteria bacterium]MBT8391154.1 phosphoglycerate dehydrogenase [Ignavibacteria bacterium]NNJ54277.1 phosphoglycerate dehydrogenase [Ignavibacteriaceae bacterium]NNL20242.1 phosphoglycerate dehydrogenase [Ignavibacteriaceae bacterium]